MRYTVAIFLTAVCLLCGCDPVGLRRIELNLQNPTASNAVIDIDSSDVKEALKFLDEIASEHGFHPIPENSAQNDKRYIRVYLQIDRFTTEDRDYVTNIHCQVRLTETGILVTFGYPGLLGGQAEAEKLFSDTRHAFIKKYGMKKVRSHRIRFD
jgi:hypothetical protein